jgi:hypothetical protein
VALTAAFKLPTGGATEGFVAVNDKFMVQVEGVFYREAISIVTAEAGIRIGDSGDTNGILYEFSGLYQGKTTHIVQTGTATTGNTSNDVAFDGMAKSMYLSLASGQMVTQIVSAVSSYVFIGYANGNGGTRFYIDGDY